VADHAVRELEVRGGIVVHCECGWQSSPASSRELADARWRIHLFERRAARSMAVALHLSEACARRRLELERLRSAMRRRRELLALERRRLQAERRRARRPAATAPRRTGALLDRALAMAGRSRVELWVAYFAIGGTLGLPEVEEVLDEARPVGPVDHDLLAMALNDWFGDAGFGRPVELWADATRAAAGR
jgi:hypothetical protein